MALVIADYGRGNLRSLVKAFERIGVIPVVSGDAAVIRDADRIVLPGVGSFGDCMQGIAGLRDVLDEAVLVRGGPFLGVCAGMQVMGDRGFENGEHQGLGWIHGDVKHIGMRMGWDGVVCGHTVVPSGEYYFMHSYGFDAGDQKDVVGFAGYGHAVIGRDNMIGVQFHPEKSQALGLRLLERFAGWTP